ncbi:hypothetical protein [uncultured Nostoc sp.]|uniref:hypothetical protein n=1 Tax=uncultured Nostoc sp. TaxID=340711 RepID=UPI002639B482|nr:hypothetical protein [uncultured Nostoc sp.]
MQLISREEIKTLIEQPKGNCVSIYMPTHPAGPEMRQDPIRFKNLVKEAETRLIDAGLEQKEAIALLEKSHECIPMLCMETGKGGKESNASISQH